MGLTVVISNEKGEPTKWVEDPANMLARLLPGEDDRTFSLLRYIDPYADTVFNQIQMTDFLAEWARISLRAHTPEEKSLLLRIEELARETSDAPHRYLKFVGD
jgi:hypothetical protein